MELIEKVKQDGLVVDGGMGSMPYLPKGSRGGECAEKWNIDRPEVIQEIHRAYFDAGADVATANTFGASSLKLEKMGIKEGVEIINTEAVKHAKAAAKPGQYVAGDLGSVGEMFSPHGQHDGRAGQRPLCPPGPNYRGRRCGPVSYRNQN